MTGLPNSLCPCASSRKYKRCCRPLHQGLDAPSPEALMRSRFSAFALGLIHYLIDTTLPLGPQWKPDRTAWEHSLTQFCATTRFGKLQILERPPPNERSPDEGQVTFHAELSGPRGDLSFSERSRFVRVAGRWLYHSGQSL